MGIINQKDPSTPGGSAGGPSPAGSSSGGDNTRNLIIVGIALGVVILITFFFKR